MDFGVGIDWTESLFFYLLALGLWASCLTSLSWLRFLIYIIRARIPTWEGSWSCEDSEPHYVGCWGLCLAHSDSFYWEIISNSNIYYVNGGEITSYPDYRNVMMCICDGQVSLWAKSRAWDPSWQSSPQRWGDSATDEVIALAHLLTQAGGCQLSESSHQSLIWWGSPLRRKKWALDTIYRNSAKTCHLSSKSTASGSLLKSQPWTLLEGRLPSACCTGSFPDIWAEAILPSGPVFFYNDPATSKNNPSVPQGPLCVF